MTKRNCLIILLFFLTSGCGGLFYHPDSRRFVDPQKLGPVPEQIELTSSFGKKFYGWYFKASEKPKGKILFFHGNAQNRTTHFYGLYWILRENYDFFIFDYPGYFDSEGTPTQESTTDAGAIALNWIDERSPKAPVIIFGQSLGGNIAMYTAIHSTQKPCLVVVDSTFASYRKVAQRILARQWLTWPFQWLPYLLISDSYSADGDIEKISPVPLAVFHSKYDPVVDFRNGQDVFAEAASPKKFYEAEVAGHIAIFNGPTQEEFRTDLLKELTQHCAAK